MGNEGAKFTRAWAGMLAPLAESGIGGKELIVLLSLMRYQGEEGREVWRPVREIASECGLSEANVRNKLTALTRKTFIGEGGQPVPIITRVGGGREGRAATYVVNLPRASHRRETHLTDSANACGDLECNVHVAESATHTLQERNVHVAPLENSKDKERYGAFSKKKSLHPPSYDEWNRFIEGQMLDPVFEMDWYRLNEKGWTDAEGRPIRDWKAYLFRTAESMDKATYPGAF